MRSMVKRASLTLRMRENSDAATPVSAFAARTLSLRRSSTAMIFGGQDGARLFEVGIRVAEIAEHVAAAAYELKAVRYLGISLSRFSRLAKRRATSRFGRSRRFSKWARKVGGWRPWRSTNHRI